MNNFNLNLNGIPIQVAEDDVTIFIPLPKELWVGLGKCFCQYCQGNKEGFWDTLAVAKGRKHTWMVHYPELHK